MNETSHATDFEAVRSVLRDYAAAWNARRPSTLKQYWDETLAQPQYVAEESEAMHDWASIERYWAALEGIDVSIKLGEPRLQRLTADVIAALYDMHWRARYDSHPYWRQPIGGNVRVSVVLARRPTGWKIVNYVEAPLASATQIKKWLERDAQG